VDVEADAVRRCHEEDLAISDTEANEMVEPLRGLGDIE